MLAHYAANRPSAERRTDEVLALAQKWYLPKTRQDKVMTNVVVRTSAVNSRVRRISLLVAKFVGGRINGMAPRVGASEFKSSAEVVLQLKDGSIIAGVNVVQGDKDTVEAIVAGRVRS